MAEARQTLVLLHALYVSADEGVAVSVADERSFGPLGDKDPALWAKYCEGPVRDPR